MDEIFKHRLEKIFKKYCEKRIPTHLRSQIRISFNIRGGSITLIEERPFYRNPSEWTKLPIAQFRYDPKSELWSLYWQRSNNRWYQYEIAPAKEIKYLLAEVDKDPMGAFWG